MHKFGNSDVGFQAYRWTSTEGIAGLGDLPGGGFSSEARRVSGDGEVVVGRSTSEASVTGGVKRFEAFRWTGATGMTGLGDLPGGVFDSIATDASTDGSVIVGAGNSAQGREAFRWTQTDGMVGLGDLGGGVFESGASAVSGDGSVVVGTGVSESGGQAFRWSSTDGIVGLGVLEVGGSTRAFDVSGDGSVVVGLARSVAGEDTPFIWDSVNGLSDLMAILLTDFGLDVAALGWDLQSATGVSADGRTIVGQGRGPNGSEGWIVRLDGTDLPSTPVPEPSTLR